MTFSIKKFFPFLAWFPLRGDTLKADFLAGLTVALVLVPQSMAYAQLAGLPPYFGLYAAFLPVMVAAMWGSSSQLGTGPVAVASLLTASALTPLATPGSEQFIALAIMLALLVGIVQLALGVFKLGVIVNFLSHPVIVGFTNAAAIIIGLSQINKLIGVPMARSEHFALDIWGVVGQLGDTHWPTLAMGVMAVAIMWLVRNKAPRLPGVLIAVVVTTLASWLLHFESNATARVEQIADAELTILVERVGEVGHRLDLANQELARRSVEARNVHRAEGDNNPHAVTLDAMVSMNRIAVQATDQEYATLRRQLRAMRVVRSSDAQGQTLALYREGKAPAGAKLDAAVYRIRGVKEKEFKLVGGGEVVGKVPEGLPSVGMPKVSWEMLGSLLSAAVIISLVGFMEAISIAKAIAAKTKQKIDANQELIGQGLANLVGSMTQAFPVSGSFSRSAVNMNSGAKTGLSSVITGLLVLLTLLFMTPLLYHLPQAVLAAVIIMAVIGLLNFGAIRHAWQANRHDGVAAVATFLATLAFAPHLDHGIMVGAGLSIGLYLYRTMSPRVAILGRHADGSLRDAATHNLPASEIVTAVRFDGRLYFANVAFFEDAILAAVAANPKARALLVVGNGINELDASGEEVMQHVVQHLRDTGITVSFSGLKEQVVEVLRATGLIEFIGTSNLYPTADKALEAIYREAAARGQDDFVCPLRPLPEKRFG